MQSDGIMNNARTILAQKSKLDNKVLLRFSGTEGQGQPPLTN